MTAAEADRRERAALDEALDQLRKGWTAREVVVVLADAARVIDDLRARPSAMCIIHQVAHEQEQANIAVHYRVLAGRRQETTP